MEPHVICMVSTYTYPSFARGLETHVRKLSEKLADSGNHVVIVSSTTTDYYPNISEFTVNVYGLQPFKEVIFSIKSIYKILNIYKVQNIDIIHFHGPPLFKFIGEIIARLTGKKVFYTMHGSFNTSIRIYLLMKLLNGRVNIITVSNEIRTKLNHMMLTNSLATIPTGITVSNFNDSRPSPQGINTLIFVGCLRKDKGAHILIRSFSEVLQRYESTRLWIVGDGPDMKSLKQMSADLGIKDKIRFFGQVDLDDIPNLLSQATIFIFPSIATSDSIEGTPTSILEAMASGLPIIASNIGGIPDVIANDVNGQLVEQNNSKELSEAIFNFIENPQKCYAMGRNNIEKAKEYDWSKVVEKILKYYHLN